MPGLQPHCDTHLIAWDFAKSMSSQVKQSLAGVRRIAEMNPLLQQLVAVAGSLVLAIPPGWCCGSVPSVPADSAPVRSTCCHHAAKNLPTKSKQPLAPPTVQCCCQRDATAPEKSTTISDATVMVVPLIVSVPGDPDGQAWCAKESILHLPGPRLHVLQCVWRC
jgi:hypothetical protein